MKSCHRCPHYMKHPGERWEDTPCAHCTSLRAELYRVKRQIIRPARVPAPAPDEITARETVLAWTHVTRAYPAAAAYVLAKLGDQSLSYRQIARRFKVSPATVQYQLSMAAMLEPAILRLLSIDRTRTRRDAYRIAKKQP